MSVADCVRFTRLAATSIHDSGRRCGNATLGIEDTTSAMCSGSGANGEFLTGTERLACSTFFSDEMRETVLQSEKRVIWEHDLGQCCSQ